MTVNTTMQCYSMMWGLKEWLTLGAEQDLTICRTGSLAEGRGSEKNSDKCSFCPPARASCCPSQLGHRSSPFSSFVPSSHLQGNFSSVSSPPPPLRTVTPALWMFCCGIGMNSSLAGTCCCLTHHCSSRAAGTGRAHRRLGTVLCSQTSCHLLEGPGVTKPSWQLAGVEKVQSYIQAKPHSQINFIYKHTNL